MWQRKHAVTLALLANAVPGVGYRACYLRPQSIPPAQEPASGVWITEQSMENTFLRITFHTNGSFDLEDKLHAQHYRGLHTFEDSEDAGSAYFSRFAPDGAVVSSQESIARIELLASGPVLVRYRIALALALPIGLTADRQRRSSELRAVSITSVVTLAAGERFARVHTTVENTVDDHRLRVCFPTGVDSSRVAAGGHYAVHERPVESVEHSDWVEQPSNAAPARLFVEANDGTRGLAVLFPDLSEYATHRDAGQVVLSLTLLRCVGWLSRSDEGPVVPTPGGQCQGIHAFDYALLPHAPEERQAFQVAEEMAAPLSAILCPPGKQRQQSLPPSAAFLTLEPASIILSALKPGKRAGELVIRCYSLAEIPVRARLQVLWKIQKACLTSLNEDEILPLNILNEHCIEIDFRPGQILTLAISVEVAMPELCNAP